MQQNPREVFLIEGHTDAVGTDVDNLSLSDRRAELVALVLTQEFGVPAENLSTQGYGKQYLSEIPPGDSTIASIWACPVQVQLRGVAHSVVLIMIGWVPPVEARLWRQVA